MNDQPDAVPVRTWLRPAVQIGFVLASILIGLEFRRFVLSLADPSAGPVSHRPPAAEAYLPISSLMSLTYWAKSGAANRVHPAGLVLFSLVLVMSLAMRRGFCSWVCPFALASEWAHKVGREVMGRNVPMPKWLDVVLRAPRYALLAFFIVFIVRMRTEGLRQFIYGPYNRIADVKMYLFFANISTTAVIVLAALTLLSALFKNFWCRYLCPYGALLGLFSLVSPIAVRRNKDKCIGCGKCSRACANLIPVATKQTVRSVECTACYDCVHACPVDGALEMRAGRRSLRAPATVYAAITVAAFIFVPQIARAFGYWHSETPAAMYRHLYGTIADIGHPRP